MKTVSKGVVVSVPQDRALGADYSTKAAHAVPEQDYRSQLHSTQYQNAFLIRLILT
jgi:hypothetical protein